MKFDHQPEGYRVGSFGDVQSEGWGFYAPDGTHVSGLTEPGALAAAWAHATRSSVIAFLQAEARKIEQAYDVHIRRQRPENEDQRLSYDLKQERLSAKVSILRTEAACVARGDDMAGAG